MAVLVAAVLCSVWMCEARAEVLLTFYSHELRAEGDDVLFPHAFVTLEGSTGDRHKVNANYGFTAVRISGGILSGPVDGHLASQDAGYVADSRRHFAVILNDDQYRKVLQVLNRWQRKPQPSYRLRGNNCVTFVKDVAESVGLTSEQYDRFALEPAAFLDDLAARAEAARRRRLGTSASSP